MSNKQITSFNLVYFNSTQFICDKTQDNEAEFQHLLLP